MRTRLTWFVHVTWGLPQTLVGAMVWLASGRPSHHAYRAAVVTNWSRNAGLSLGPFVFLPRYSSRRLLVHEYGHTVQSLLLGPLYLPVIVLPSLMWAGVPAFNRMRRRRHLSYYALYTERWANWLGELVCGEASMGQAFVD